MYIFDFNDYRKFIKYRFSTSERKGRGKAQELAKHLRVHPSIVSQVLSGARDFNEDQGLLVSEFFELNSLEERYLNLLIRKACARTAQLKKHLQTQLSDLKIQEQQISEKFSDEAGLSEANKSIFYSSWKYSAIRLYCSTKKSGRTVEDVAAKYSLKRPDALEMLTFLCKCGLCKKSGTHYFMGPQSTFAPRGSPHLLKHHANWRLKALEKAEIVTDEEMVFSSALSISQKDFAKIRKQLADFLSSISKTVEESEAQEVACLNLDFFRI